VANPADILAALSRSRFNGDDEFRSSYRQYSSALSQIMVNLSAFSPSRTNSQLRLTEKECP
jgi:hypothetical protein